MTQPGTETTNTYIIDTEDPTELTRLMEQDRLLTAQTGLFPRPPAELFPTPGEDEVLDLACGPGGWAIEVSYALPSVEVTGIDLSPSMVGYATMRARTQHRENVSFEVMDITQPLSLSDSTFRYINARFLLGFLRPEQWLPLLQECKRLLVPGGTLCLTEAEWAMTNSRAYETLKRMVTRALWVAKQSLSPDGQDLGVTPLLSSFLRQAGYQELGQKATAIEWSAGIELHTSMMDQSRAAFALLRPFVLKMGMATAETYDALYGQMLEEVSALTFCGVFTPLTVWGHAPLEEELSWHP